MKNYILSLLVISQLTHSLISIGPQINYHWTAKDEKDRWSFGFESAYYWSSYVNTDGTSRSPYLPMGLNLGYEWTPKSHIIYTQYQLSFFAGGLSAGPALLIPKNNHSAYFTPQFNIWCVIPFGVGAGYAFRKTSDLGSHNVNFFAKGLFTDDFKFLF